MATLTLFEVGGVRKISGPTTRDVAFELDLSVQTVCSLVSRGVLTPRVEIESYDGQRAVFRIFNHKEVKRYKRTRRRAKPTGGGK